METNSSSPITGTTRSRSSVAATPVPAIAGGVFAFGLVLSTLPHFIGSTLELHAAIIGTLSTIGNIALVISLLAFATLIAVAIIQSAQKTAVR